MFSIFIYPLGVLLHTLLVFGSTFYLSPEISLYPYFISRGLTPYSQLIDQHFPLIFFGPLNLSQFAVTSPTASLIAFLVVIFVTDLVAFIHLKRQPLVFIGFVLAQAMLGGSTFWLDSFLLLFLVCYLHSPRSVLGILALSLGVALRPTLLPFALLLLFIKSRPLRASYLVFATVPLLEILWLSTNRLWPDFYLLSSFNLEYYSALAQKLPTVRQLILAALVFLPTLSLTNLLILIPGLVLLYPRFELYHLLPLSFIFLTLPKIPRWWLVIALIVVLKSASFRPQNFYYSPSLYQQAAYLSNIYDLKSATAGSVPVGHNIYFFGGPDQLYQLTQTLPPANYYLPSLPWYLSNPEFVGRQIQSLSDNPNSLVVVNTQSRLGGVSLLDYGKPIWQFIKQHYQKIDSLDNLDIYQFVIRN